MIKGARFFSKTYVFDVKGTNFWFIFSSVSISEKILIFVKSWKKLGVIKFVLKVHRTERNEFLIRFFCEPVFSLS